MPLVRDTGLLKEGTLVIQPADKLKHKTTTSEWPKGLTTSDGSSKQRQKLLESVITSEKTNSH